MLHVTRFKRHPKLSINLRLRRNEWDNLDPIAVDTPTLVKTTGHDSMPDRGPLVVHLVPQFGYAVSAKNRVRPRFIFEL